MSAAYQGAQQITPGDEGVTKVICPTIDLAASLKFFEDILGYTVEDKSEASSTLLFSQHATLRTPNGLAIQLVVVRPEFATRFPGTVVSVAVSDFHETCSALGASGLDIWPENVTPDASGGPALFNAPDGTVFQIVQTKGGMTRALSAQGETGPNQTPPNADSVFGALGNTGVEWILVPTQRLDAMAAFLIDVLGYSKVTEGIPSEDLQYARYAVFTTPSGVVLELVEPTAEHMRRYPAPVVSFTVPNLNDAINAVQRSEAELLTDVVAPTSPFSWVYFRAPGGGTFQLQGPMSAAV